MYVKYPVCLLIRKNSVTKSEYKQLLHKVTSDEKSFPEDRDLRIIARASFYRKETEQMLKHVFKKLQGPRKKWRKILKTLNLMRVIVQYGSKKAIEEFKKKVFLVRNLYEFTYVENSMDRGARSMLSSKRNC